MITDINGVVDGLANNSQLFVVNKASIANATAGVFHSLFRATGTPAQGAIPSTAAVCNRTLTGAFQFTNPGSGIGSYIGRAFIVSGNTATDIQLHDRLAHMGGLNGTLTTAQTAAVDVSGSTDNMALRRGASDYSDVQWWLEWYTDTGATAVTATVTYTNAANTSGRTTTVALGATTRASRMLSIIGQSGEFIRSVQSVQLSASTLTAGNFGVTATRALTSVSLGLANAGSVYDWALLGLPRVHDDACLALVTLPGTTSTGTLVGTAKLVQG